MAFAREDMQNLSIKNFDYVIIGAGIVGMTIARALCKKGIKSIAIIEKESGVGKHTSGRNSGVLHSGVYYPSDSLKAKFCSTGSKLMRAYADEKGVKYKTTGKVIVALNNEQMPMIDFLYQRGLANGVKVKKISLAELNDLEPEAKSFGEALHCPETAVIDSKSILKQLTDELADLGIQIFFDEKVKQINVSERSIMTEKNKFSYGHLVNAAGLHADRLAHQMEVGLKYKIMPFKGLYKKIIPTQESRFRGSIYPVPDLKFPFLGVHITRTADEHVYVGPTAIPAFGRENYGVIAGMSPLEFAPISYGLSKMFFNNHDNFRNYVSAEMGKYSKTGFWKCVKALAPNLAVSDLESSEKVGIRAQLVDQEKMKFVMDFVVEKGSDSTHILNAISPAFTCSFAFADWIVQGLP